jgi:UDP-N-acetylglucosamine--N-acetylmuramyl-(pentapeptide) pyrophosphoryl-undecaprenol N-acetylglucosamine transferase
MPHLVIMAAGTGGHIIPGIAVAREVQRRGWSVSWLGTATGMENTLVPPTQIPLDVLAFSGLRGKGLLHTATGGLRLLKAFWDAARILRRRGASAVLGMGGYVCFPGGMMASLLGKPLMLVNADAALLLSNKALLPVADRVAFGFDGPASQIKRGLVTGNPVRAEIEALPAPAARYAGRSGPLRLLVVGGSLGAQVLNQTLPAALALIPEAARPQVLHQTGAAQLETVRAAYAAAGIAADVRPFIDDMAQQLAGCDVIDLPRRRGDGQRAVRRRRAQPAGAAGGQHHRPPARQRATHGRPRRGAAHRPEDPDTRQPGLPIAGTDAPGPAGHGRTGPRPGQAASRGPRGR